MPQLTIDLHGITLDHLLLTDNPTLIHAVREAISPTKATMDSAGFDNRV